MYNTPKHNYAYHTYGTFGSVHQKKSMTSPNKSMASSNYNMASPNKIAPPNNSMAPPNSMASSI